MTFVAGSWHRLVPNRGGDSVEGRRPQARFLLSDVCMMLPLPPSSSRPGFILVLCVALLNACSEAPPDAGGQAAGAGSAAEGGRSGSAGGEQAGGAGSAAEGGRSGSAGAAQIERSSVAADDSPDISDDDYAAFIKAVTGFGLELGQNVAVSEGLTTKNAVYSPLSAAYALAMTYAGARGQTGLEMKSVLRDGFEEDTYHSGANRLARDLAARATTETRPNGKEGKVELNLAASLFLERTLQVQPTFLDLLAREYASGVQRLDFRGAHEAARLTINDWVAEQTKDKILDLIPMDKIDENTPFVLVNALYFYGSWSQPFMKEATRPADFHTLGGETLQVPTMHGYGMRTGSASTTDFNAVELGYIGNSLSMIIVVPAQDKFESIRSTVTSAWLEQTIDSFKPSYLNVTLPKFKMTVGSFSLDDGLKELGMKQAFENDADFSGLAAGVKVATVLQKAFIAVDEDGTEAAAATAVIGGPTSAPIDQPVPFVIDRPFLFFIRDESGAVLFSGHVVDPSK